MMRRTFAAVSALLFCGCASLSPRLSELSGKASVANLAVQQAKDGETPKEARGRYEAFLALNSMKQPLAFYQERLKQQLKGLTAGNKEVFNQDAAWAFPCVFDERTRAAAAARVGLARVSLAESDAKAALTHACAAADEVLDKMLSPVGFSPLLAEAYGIQERAYAMTGAVGEALMARTNGNLIRDYDKSAQAETDRTLKIRADLICRREMSTLDDVVDNVNVHRDTVAQEKFNAAGNAIIGGLNQVNKMVQAQNGGGHYSAPSGGGGRADPWIQGFQAVTAAMAPAGAQNKTPPLGGLAFSQGSLVLDQHAKTLDIIKGFATAAAALSGDSSVKESAKAVLSAADAVAKGRQGADGPKPDTLAVLGQSLNVLQGQLAAPPASAQ